MDDLLAEFLAETREMLTAIGGELVAWEACPADRARLDSVFRFVHTVKGNCGFFDFPRLEALSHAAEDALAEVRAGRRTASPQLVTAVLAIIDRIAAMIDAIETGEELPSRGDEFLIAALAAQDETADYAVVSSPEDAARSTPAAAQRSIRLPVGLLDSVMSNVSDLVLARNDLARRMRGSDGDPAVQGPFERLSAILDQVRESVTRMRMQRIEHLYGALPRLVRDLSAELGKQVLVDLEGGEVELDREMIETIRDPLTHIIRNAIDHGIESPSQRLGAGKREIGTLTISARQSGNRIMLAISDDGRGIDAARLTEKAVAAGIVSAKEAETLSDEARNALVFEPGLSTAAAVTAVSGRGVGMDVVRANIERVGGSITVSSVPGQGTRILVSLPLTLSIVPALTVRAADQMFAIPRSYVDEIVHGRAAHLEFARAGDAVLATIRGRRVACLSLAVQLGLATEFDPSRCTLVLIRLAAGDLFALAVDRIHDHEDLVIKPLAPALTALGVYAGCTLLDDGKPVLMLDIAGLAREAKVIGEAGKRIRIVETSGTVDRAAAIPALLFVGCNGARRAIRLGAIHRVERVEASALDLSGKQPRVVIDDRILALAGVDGPIPEEGLVNILRLSDGGTEVAYLFDRILDTVELADDIVPASAPGPIEGTALVGGLPTDFIDPHWLFATFAAPPRTMERPVCRLDDSDPWARTILAPLIESAGYRVVGDSFEGSADVAIASEAATGDRGPAQAIITLCADPDRAATLPGSFYRYDRAGLLAALTALRSGKAA
ncbi:chemotaxis protein CheA [Altererythrobacter aerius]|uniref:Chemotaxis protein CheA n=1 Tax=Tsuneonella aeria TaxID=1837929 RepID=A0A6I4TER7_9SPHN|nr:chemotaxis protein CheA [Tsuneonella aeria]MXO75811.1 chemotaxis protein CheA [Tsuneonella aeria]